MSRRWLRAPARVAALVCVVVGVGPPVGEVYATEDCTLAAPDASDYCASNKCGPCLEGEGDCDSGQCQAGLECAEEGSVDRCRACTAAPDSSSYCSSNECGPCAEGQGDCDPGQCQAGLECAEEGSVDRCRPIVGGCSAQPESGDFCSSSQCGPCAEGEGDCDPGQCDAGLVCVEEGSVDHCRVDTGCSAQPESSDYCGTCGPCADGEGDCDAGQCDAGLECVEEGQVDHCRPIGNSTSNFQVSLNGVWQGICCEGSTLKVSTRDCVWTELSRVMTDTTAGLQLDCPEGGPTDCDCDGSGENMHGAGGGNLSSLKRTSGSKFYSDHSMVTCVVVDANGELVTETTSANCPNFRLQ